MGDPSADGPSVADPSVVGPSLACDLSACGLSAYDSLLARECVIHVRFDFYQEL